MLQPIKLIFKVLNPRQMKTMGPVLCSAQNMDNIHSGVRSQVWLATLSNSAGAHLHTDVASRSVPDQGKNTDLKKTKT